MAVTWSVVSLDSTKTVGSLSDVVTTVHWTASDSETVGENTYTGSSYGSIGLAEADSSSFTAYADIKESDAIAWAKAAILVSNASLLVISSCNAAVSKGTSFAWSIP